MGISWSSDEYEPALPARIGSARRLSGTLFLAQCGRARIAQARMTILDRMRRQAFDHNHMGVKRNLRAATGGAWRTHPTAHELAPNCGRWR